MDPEVDSPPVVLRRPWLPILGTVFFLLFVLSLIFYFRSHRRGEFVSGFVSAPAANLASTAGRTNLVFLGFGGEGHEAGDLTDSIIFISLSHSTSSVSLLSLPRDIWIDTLQAKINTAYHYGRERRKGGGLDLAKSAVAEVTGQPVHYALALDFAGFVQVIDAVGGIDLEIPHTFDDYRYPIPGKETAEPESARYEHLHFEAGPMHMDGATALKYARSRHAEGEEGTDFARGARQQQIILAFKDRLLQSQTLLDFDTLSQIMTRLRSSLDTDIQDGEFGSFFRFFLSFQTSGQPHVTLNLDSYLSNPQNKAFYQGQWVLVPTHSWDEIHNYVAKNLAQ